MKKSWISILKDLFMLPANILSASAKLDSFNTRKAEELENKMARWLDKKGFPSAFDGKVTEVNEVAQNPSTSQPMPSSLVPDASQPTSPVSAATQPTSEIKPEPAQEMSDNIGMTIIKDFLYAVKDVRYSDRSLSGPGMKSRPERIEVYSENGKGVYYVWEGKASSKVKEIANTLGIEYKPGWQAARIAQEVLKHVLGSKYENPQRGENYDIYNCAIFDGWLLLHTYENDGLGHPNSIKTGCYVYH